MKFKFAAVALLLFTFYRTDASVHIEVSGICTTDTSFFSLSNTTGIDSAIWTFGDSISGSGDTLRAIKGKHVYQDDLSYNVTVKFYIAGVAYTLDTTVNILEIPLDYLPSPFINFCEGTIDTLVAGKPGNHYDWHGFNDTTNELIITSSKPDTIDIWVTATNVCGENDQFTTVTFVQKPTLNLGPDTVVCHANSIVLHLNDVDDNDSYTIINWSNFGPDTVRTVRASGTYYVTITNIYCGSLSASVKVTFSKPLLPVTLGQDTFFCPGTHLVFNVAQPSATYLWQDSTTKATDTIFKTTHVEVIVTNNCGADTAAVNATFVPLSLHLPDDTLLCYGNSLAVNIFLDSTTNYLWSNGSTSPSIIISQPGTYTARVQNQCGALSDSFKVQVHSCHGCINIPDAFTPNGDGRNDLFRVLSDCQFPDFSLKIYDRWGKMIFEASDIAEGWDGTYKGKPMPIGSYTYVLDYSTLDAGAASSGTTTGYVLLIR